MTNPGKIFGLSLLIFLLLSCGGAKGADNSVLQIEKLGSSSTAHEFWILAPTRRAASPLRRSFSQALAA